MNKIANKIIGKLGLDDRIKLTKSINKIGEIIIKYENKKHFAQKIFFEFKIVCDKEKDKVVKVKKNLIELFKDIDICKEKLDKITAQQEKLNKKFNSKRYKYTDESSDDEDNKKYKKKILKEKDISTIKQNKNFYIICIVSTKSETLLEADLYGDLSFISNFIENHLNISISFDKIKRLKGLNITRYIKDSGDNDFLTMGNFIKSYFKLTERQSLECNTILKYSSCTKFLDNKDFIIKYPLQVDMKFSIHKILNAL